MQGSFAVGWRQVIICFLLLSTVSMIAATYSIIAVPLAKEFQPTRTVLMLSMTVLSAMGAVLSPLLGTLMDRFSVRTLMVTGGLLLSSGYAAISLAPTFNIVLVVFAVLIAPANVLIGPVAATVLLSRWFAERRGLAIGIAIAGISAGAFAFPFIIGGLLDAHEWRVALRLLALVLLLWTVPAALMVVDRPELRGLNPDGAPEPPAQARAEADSAPVTTWRLFSDPAFWLIAVTVAIVTSGMKGMITNLSQLAIDNGITATRAASLISVYAVGGFLAKFTFALLADRGGPRRLMAMSLTGFALGLAMLTQAHFGYAAIAAGVFIIGLFGGLMVPTESYLAPRVFGQRAVGKAMGLLSGTILIALLATPPLFGFISDVTGSYSAIYWTFAGLAIAALLWLPLIRLHPREQAAPVQPVPAG